MNKRLLLAFAGVCLLAMSLPSLAQSNELAITGGGQFSNNSYFSTGNSWVVGGNFAHRLAGVPMVGLYFELPVIVAPKSTIDITASDYSSLYVTPGLKVKFAGAFPISPYLAAGVGVARFHTNSSSTTSDQSSTKAVFDVGGGIDMKVAPFFSVRGEVRDFYSGLPDFSALGNVSGRQNNVVAQAGLVFRF